MIQFKLLGPAVKHDYFDVLGYVPNFFDESDPRPAREQIHENYTHGGGWFPSKIAWKMTDYGLESPYEEPPGFKVLPLLAKAQLRDETLLFYLGAWLVILQKDGTFEVGRVD